GERITGRVPREGVPAAHGQSGQESPRRGGRGACPVTRLVRADPLWGGRSDRRTGRPADRPTARAGPPADRPTRAGRPAYPGSAFPRPRVAWPVEFDGGAAPAEVSAPFQAEGHGAQAVAGADAGEDLQGALPGDEVADVPDHGTVPESAQRAVLGEAGQVVVGASGGVAQHRVDRAPAAEDGEEQFREPVGGAGLGLRSGGQGAARGLGGDPRRLQGPTAGTGGLRRRGGGPVGGGGHGGGGGGRRGGGGPGGGCGAVSCRGGGAGRGGAGDGHRRGAVSWS